MNTTRNISYINIDNIKKECWNNHKKLLYRYNSENDLHIDTFNIWKTSNHENHKQVEAIKSSELFSDKRVETFIKFNYRNIENKHINYSQTYHKIIPHLNKLKHDKPSHKGTMNVSELWSEKNMQ